MGSVWKGIAIYTVGHSTRTLEELVALVSDFGVTTLADVRTIPRSRHNPQFNADVLAVELPRRGMVYAPVPKLGGLRKTRPGSANGGWHNASFRGFADYMASDDFESGLAELWAIARASTTAIVCAEAVPWRCHRSLIADALLIRGAGVRHITARKRASEHHLTSFAQVRGQHIVYPAYPSDPSERAEV